MIYTKTGDRGATSLVGGSRVRKDDIRVEAYGTVDELNAHIGLLAETLKLDFPDAFSQLAKTQRDLFTIQTLLATEDCQLRATFPQITADDVCGVEKWIDTLVAELPPLKSFVVPGGSFCAAQCHVARCVCRRAERRVVSLACTCFEERQEDGTSSGLGDYDLLLRYLNRLSDYLFVLSRKLSIEQGEERCITVG